MVKRRVAVMAVAALGLGIPAGCANNHGVITSMSSSTRQDVFQEPAAATPVPAGYADLHVVATLKTHMPYSDPGKDPHGTPEYRLLVNIDGQAVQLSGYPREDRRDKYPLRDPEEGDGMSYQFKKELRLKSGVHTIFVSLPFDDVAVEQEITLTEGSSNNLVLKPVYKLTANKRRAGFYSPTSFEQGIQEFRFMLNGRSL